MTIETAKTPADDFDAAFSQFSTPEGETKAAETPAAPAATAAETPAAEGGNNDTGGTDKTAAPAGSGDGTGDSGAGAPAAGGEVVAPPNEADKGAAPAAAPASGDAGGSPAPAAAPAAGAPAAAPAATDADAILNKLGELVQAASKPAEEKKPEGEAKTPESPYTADQLADITQYEKDWPDVSRVEGLKRQGEYKQLLDFVFGEVRKYVDPLRETLDALAGRTHLADVKQVVTDYSDSLRQQVVDWVKSQPAYLQPAYEHVINSGTVDEVKDLVDRYRQATGQAAPAPGGAPSGQSGQGKGGTNELSGAAKEAAAALAPVESKRSEVVGSGDPSTFEDAWSQFSKDLG